MDMQKTKEIIKAQVLVALKKHDDISKAIRDLSTKRMEKEVGE